MALPILTFSDPMLISNNDISFSHTFSGSNRWGGVVILGKGTSFIGPDNATTFFSPVPTVGGAAMTLRGEVTRFSDPNLAAYLFGKTAPASGSQTVAITHANGIDAYAIAIAAQNVDQTTPLQPQSVGFANTWREDTNRNDSTFERTLLPAPGGVSVDAVIGLNQGGTPTPLNSDATVISTQGTWFGRLMMSYLAGASRLGWQCVGDTGLFVGLNFSLVPDGTTTGRVPGAPLMRGAVAGNAELTVIGSPPDDPGSAPINLYRVTLTPGGATFTSSSVAAIRCSGGVSNGTAYTAQLDCSNNGGSTWSPKSAVSNAVTPSASIGARGGGFVF